MGDFKMRKITLGMNISLDGYVAGPSGELDWIFPNVTPAQMEVINESTRNADTILIGRNTYIEQAATWPTQTHELADLLNSYTKVVFSKTLDKLEWNNSRFATGDIVDEVAKLQRQPGKNIFVTGGVMLAQSFIHAGLIDELTLFVHPVLLGEGKPLFGKMGDRQNVKLIDFNTFETGVVQHTYQKA